MLWARHRATGSPSWAYFPGADPHKIPIDPNGNLASKTEGSDTWVYTWNAENQFTKVEKNGAEVARFSYDAAGRRVEKVAGGATTSYTYDDLDVLREGRGTSTLKYVTGPGNDELLAVDDELSLSYFHQDGLGSVLRVTGAGGAALLTREYDAWGRLRLGASHGGYAFTGREWEPETALYYYRARYYDPEAARFTSEDPIGRRAGVNYYAYVENEPAGRRDPRGLDWKSKAKKAASAMMTGIGLWDLYKYCRNVKDCNQRANEACQQYETPDWKQGPLGNTYDANYSRRNACINWAYNCCIKQAGAGGFNILNPIPVSVVPEPTCDFGNPPGF